MGKLTITDSSGRERQVELTGKPQVFGRGEDSDVVLGSRSVARHHMKVWLDGDKVMVEDMTDGQGLKLDGESATGTFQLEPSAIMEAGIFTITAPGERLDTSLDGAALKEAAPVPLLHGTKGPTKGLEIELQEGDNDVGRDPALYLVIDDQSVSRQHARLTVQAGKFLLVDMRSSNGTFLNNRRIDRADLKSGDLVRFGNLEFRFLFGKPIRGAMDRRKRLLMIGGGAAGLILVLGLGVKICSRPPPKQVDQEVEVEVPIEVQVEQIMRQARAFAEEYDWEKALKEVDSALDLHPICRECRLLKATLEQEKANKILFDDADVLYQLNKWKEALVAFKRIPENSAYFKRVRNKIKEIADKLSEYYLTEGKSYYKANNYKKAHENFIAYMEINPCDSEVYNKWIKKSESSMSWEYIGHSKFVYSCDKPDTGPALERIDPQEALKVAYPDRQLFDAVWDYREGKVDSAVNKLRKIKALSRDKGLVEKAIELDRYLMIIRGKFTEGTTSMLQGKVDEARQKFDVALENDRKIMPENVTSFYREEMGKALAGRLYKEGLEKFNRESYRDAYQIWSDCLRRYADDKDCQGGMLELQRVGNNALDFARSMVAQGNHRRALEVFQEIKEITPPESLAYKAAVLEMRKFEENE